MQIIDAQIHLWDREVDVVPPHRREPFGLDEALREMDAAGVYGAIIHPPSWDPGSLALAKDAVRRYPDRFAILARIDPLAPDRLDQLEAWLDTPGMLGLRYTFLKPHERAWMDDGTMDWLWPEAERLGIPIAILADGYLGHIDRIATTHPKLRLIIDHFGVRRGNLDDAAFASLPDVLALARHGNVALKVTGGPQYVSGGYPFVKLVSHYRAIHSIFGPDRMFWGTDITRMPCSWRACVTAFTDHQDWCSAEDMATIMGDGIKHWLGWNPILNQPE